MFSQFPPFFFIHVCFIRASQCNAQIEAEIQRHSSQLSILGFHLIGVGFLYGRQVEDIQFEINRHRQHADSLLMTSEGFERYTVSTEIGNRPFYGRTASTGGPDSEGTSSIPTRQRTLTLLEESTTGHKSSGTFPVSLPSFLGDKGYH